MKRVSTDWLFVTGVGTFWSAYKLKLLPHLELYFCLEGGPCNRVPTL